MDNTEHSPELLKVSEAARLLGYHTRTIYRYIWSGVLQAVRVGGQYRIRRSDLQALVALNDKPAGGNSSLFDIETQAGALKCAACRRLIKSSTQVGARCVIEGCTELICRECYDSGIRTCPRHTTSRESRLQSAQAMLQVGEVTALLRGSEARLREINFLNRIKTRLNEVATLAHPLSADLLNVENWDALLESRDERSRLMQITGKVILDASTLAQTPLNASLLYRVPHPRRAGGPPLQIHCRVLSHLEAYLEDGFDCSTFSAEDLTPILLEQSQPAAGERVFSLVVLAATTGWDESARQVIAGSKQIGQAFVTPDAFIYLYDMETGDLIFNRADERQSKYADLFQPLLPGEEAPDVIAAVKDLLLRQGHTSLTLSNALHQLPYTERAVRFAFERMAASGRYNLEETPDLGLAIIEKL